MRNNDDHARQASYTPPGLIGTNTTPPAERRWSRPLASFSITTNSWFHPRPTGATRRPPFASWSMVYGYTARLPLSRDRNGASRDASGNGRDTSAIKASCNTT